MKRTTWLDQLKQDWLWSQLTVQKDKSLLEEDADQWKFKNLRMEQQNEVKIVKEFCG